jgi:hypothetical protein
MACLPRPHPVSRRGEPWTDITSPSLCSPQMFICRATATLVQVEELRSQHTYINLELTIYQQATRSVHQFSTLNQRHIHHASPPPLHIPPRTNTRAVLKHDNNIPHSPRPRHNPSKHHNNPMLAPSQPLHALHDYRYTRRAVRHGSQRIEYRLHHPSTTLRRRCTPSSCPSVSSSDNTFPRHITSPCGFHFQRPYRHNGRARLHNTLTTYPGSYTSYPVSHTSRCLKIPLQTCGLLEGRGVCFLRQIARGWVILLRIRVIRRLLL